MSEFGDSFRTVRESKSLTIAQVAEETRISARFLKAIEDEDFQTLPGGLFNRGFVRAYAKRLGLDPDDAVRRYVALVPAAPVEATDSAVVEPVASDGIERHIVPIAIGALVVLVVILFFVFGGGGTESTSDTGPAAPQEAADNDIPPRTEATLRAEPEEVAAEDPGETTPAIESAPSPSDEAETGTDPPAPVGPVLVVEVDARNATWIRVLSDDDRPEEMTMQPGSNRTFSAERVLDMQIGNAAGVSLRINGEAAPPLGGDGQVVRLNITPENYRSFLAPEE